MKKRLKINGVIMVLASGVVVAFPGLFFRQPSLKPGEQAAKILGVILILMGQLLRASARGFKAQHSGQGASLIQNGPYSFVRNPMYLGILLIGLGVVLMLFQWWAAPIFLSIFAMRYITLAQSEEKKLSALFPGAYQEYCRKVPRIIPSFAGLLKRDMREFLPLKYSWLKKEIGSALALLLPVLLVEAWIDSKSIGIKSYIPEAVARIVILLFFICFGLRLYRHTEGLNGDGSSRRKSH